MSATHNGQLPRFPNLVKRALLRSRAEGETYLSTARRVFGLGRQAAALLCDYFDLDPWKVRPFMLPDDDLGAWKYYRIRSLSDVDMGLWGGATPTEALARMHQQANHEVIYLPEQNEIAYLSLRAAENCGGVTEWLITEEEQP